MSEQLSQQQYKRGIQYKRGDSNLAASWERFRDFSQSVGPQILTWTVIKINSWSVNELTDWYTCWHSCCRLPEDGLCLRPEAVTRLRAELRWAALERAESSTYKRYWYLIFDSGMLLPVARDCDTRLHEEWYKLTWHEYACRQQIYDKISSWRMKR